MVTYMVIRDFRVRCKKTACGDQLTNVFASECETVTVKQWIKWVSFSFFVWLIE
jgi:hypothetical protein